MTDAEAVAAVMGLVTAAMTSPEDLDYLLAEFDDPRAIAEVALGCLAAAVGALWPLSGCKSLPEFLQQFSAGMQAAALEGL